MHLTAQKKYQSSKMTALVKTLKAIKQAICNYVKLFPLFLYRIANLACDFNPKIAHTLDILQVEFYSFAFINLFL